MLKALLFATLCALSYGAQAEEARVPHPADASAVVPATPFVSAFADYTPWREQAVAPWRETNQAVSPRPAAVPAAPAAEAKSGKALQVVKPHDHGQHGH